MNLAQGNKQKSGGGMATNDPILLLTGVTGFIGFHVAQSLASSRSYQILAIVRRNSHPEKLKILRNEGVQPVQGYFGDPKLLDRVFKDNRINYVAHLAALRGAGSGRDEDFTRVNVLGTESLLDCSLKHGVQKFIHCSSVGVHGTVPQELPARISSPFVGDNAYHASKIAAEQRVQEYICKGLNANIIRPTIVYGWGDNGFSRKLVALVRKRLLPVHNNLIHLLNVNKFAELLKLVLEDSGRQRVFIAADEKPIYLKELADLIHQHYYKSPYPSWLKLPERAISALDGIFRFCGNKRWLTSFSLIYKSWFYDMSDAVRELGYVPANTKETFISSMCNPVNYAVSLTEQSRGAKDVNRITMDNLF